MAKKRKRKKPENERYEFEVEDWEMDYHFELNVGPKDFIPGVFWENSKCTLIGKIVSPILKNANKARVEIVDKPELDDNWKINPTVRSAKGIGSIEIPRGDDTVIFYCWVPSRSFQYIPLAVSSGKIKFALIFGTRLKWRKGDIFSISLSTIRDEE
jgi:hypothetical protein